MKVKELIKELEQFDKELPIFFMGKDETPGIDIGIFNGKTALNISNTSD